MRWLSAARTEKVEATRKYALIKSPECQRDYGAGFSSQVNERYARATGDGRNGEFEKRMSLALRARVVATPAQKAKNPAFYVDAKVAWNYRYDDIDR